VKIFKAGDRLAWKTDDPALADRIHGLMDQYGEGPFEVAEIVPVPEGFAGLVRHPQLLILKGLGSRWTDHRFPGTYFRCDDGTVEAMAPGVKDALLALVAGLPLSSPEREAALAGLERMSGHRAEQALQAYDRLKAILVPTIDHKEG